MLKQWEHFVQQANLLKVAWKATPLVRICSDHFNETDYIIPPSSNGTCRLKKNAVPSKSSSLHGTPYAAIPSEVRCRLDLSNKRPFPPTDLENLAPPIKTKKTEEEKRNELEQNLKHKINNLQQQLR